MSGRNEIVWGLVILVIGFVLWFATPGVRIPIIELTKVGVVLMFVGGIGALYGVYRLVAGGRSNSSDSR